MSKEEDDAKAYTTYEGIVGRSFRRGTRKAIKALSAGLLGGGDPVSGSLGALGADALKELPTAIKRSKRNRD